jgi:hypothetical protein
MDFQCCICTTDIVSVRFSRCVHRVCVTCARRLRRHQIVSCPLCREQIHWEETPIDGDDCLLLDPKQRILLEEQRHYLRQHMNLLLNDNTMNRTTIVSPNLMSIARQRKMESLQSSIQFG